LHLSQEVFDGRGGTNHKRGRGKEDFWVFSRFDETSEEPTDSHLLASLRPDVLLLVRTFLPSLIRTRIMLREYYLIELVTRNISSYLTTTKNTIKI